MQNLIAFELALKKQKKKKFISKRRFIAYPLKPHSKGAKAEKRAKQYLQSQGLIYLESNLACPFGEIDLLMKDQEKLVFIEVKERTSCQYGHAIEQLQSRKQEKIIKTALYLLPYIYIHFFNGQKPDYRFDLIDIENNQIRWTKNAFLKSTSSNLKSIML